jgi:uncharacterized membrane protein YgdD (TMEM256/DUF423 family)
VVDVANGANVNVWLGSLEYLLCHANALLFVSTASSQIFALAAIVRFRR